MKKGLFETLLLCCLFFSINALNAQTFEWINCNSVKIGIGSTGSGGVCTDCYDANNNKMFARFEVFEVFPNGSRSFSPVTIQTTPYSWTKTFTYVPGGIFELGSDYVVDVFFATRLDGICQSFPSTPPGGCLGAWVFSGTTQVFSFGDIVHNWTVADNSGTMGNALYCLSDLEAGGGPFVVGGLHGEAEWKIDICLVDPNNNSNCLAWTSTYWQTGTMPQSVDLLNDVWRKWHPSWTFWTTNTYRANMVGRKDDCDGWNSFAFTFTSVNGNCKILEAEGDIDITLYPNPTSDVLKLEPSFNLSPVFEEEIDYQIFDLNGRALKQGKIMSINEQIDVFDLNKGVYILHLDVNGQVISKRFTVI